VTDYVLLGIRHHGPGSARAVERALAAYRPEIVLIEGPPEADALVAFAASEQLRPPVALLAYPVDKNAVAATRASFWPFAEFSPEWRAIRWAVTAGVPVRFFDLPAANRLAPERVDKVPVDQPEPTEEPAEEPMPAEPDPLRADPIAALATVAGYDDPERWWEDVVEHRLDAHTESSRRLDLRSAQIKPENDPLTAALDPFDAIAEAMAEVRADTPAPPPAEARDEARREAYMRGVLRAARKEYPRVAVVCGAWHVPALTEPLPAASADAKVLRKLPKVKVAATWVPWTHGRLASWQGYGAGVSSPGWYHHLFTAPDRVLERWFVQVAGVLRDEGQPVSSAHVIEAVRLAATLAAIRGRPLAGLPEVTEATHAVLCDGDDLRLALVNRRLVVGERLGEVPEDMPSVPLVRDVAAAQRSLRLPPQALVRDLDLDLRREIDVGRSRLLHRLRLLGVNWGTPAPTRSGTGTFWESWRLQWQPEFAVDLVAASGYGTTVAAAATSRIAELASAAASLGEVTALVERCLLAHLPDALAAVLRALDDRIALDHDVAHLMSALPALARTLRYGDVRGTDTGALRTVAEGLVVRICVGLPPALAALDDSAALEMRDRIDAVHSALALLDGAGQRERWLETLARLAERDDLHGLIAGRVNRLLLDAGRVDVDEVRRRLGLVLTVGVPPARGAAWVEGFLAGGGLLLVHDERLLALVDSWLAGIPDDLFIEVLPLLRRTFASFAEPERRSIGERARRLGDRSAPAAAGDDLDPDRVALVLPTVALLLGTDLDRHNFPEVVASGGTGDHNLPEVVPIKRPIKGDAR
jgi:hypothetical protein